LNTIFVLQADSEGYMLKMELGPANIVFDLDGTLTDPFEGVTKSINYALTQLGFEGLPPEQLKKYIGPPLKDTFAELLKKSALVDEAIHKFRERYFDTGYKENVPYPGVWQLLAGLHGSGANLHIATSKRQDIAQTVILHFGFDPFFKSVRGSGGLNAEKSQLLVQIKRSDPRPVNIMVGDRCFDMVAAKKGGFTSIGVLWGYGSREELMAHGAQATASSLAHLPAIIQKIVDRKSHAKASPN
jgi:phosphoglycolate phosphatase